MLPVRSLFYRAILLATCGVAACGPSPGEARTASVEGLPAIGLSHGDERFARCIALRWNQPAADPNVYYVDCLIEGAFDSEGRGVTFVFNPDGFEIAAPRPFISEIVELRNGGEGAP